ncbi:MAG: hypothetical protein ACKN9O_02795 [Actinomycetota bacterium]
MKVTARQNIGIALTLTTLFFLAGASPSIAAVGDVIPGRTFEPRNPPYWLACSTLNQTDNCVESIELFDEKTKTWIKGVELKNSWYKQGASLPLREEDPSGKFVCGTGNTSEYDVCYEFPGAAIDGSNQYVAAIVYSKEEVPGFPRIKNSFVPLNGVDPRKPLDSRTNGWQVLKPGTTWRMTLIADKVAKGAGLAWAWMKNPSIDIETGKDGKQRLITSGSVQEVHSYRHDGPWDKNPCMQDTKNELVANDYRVEYSINIDPYVGEYAILQGTPPGGIFLNSNGGCAYEVKFDRQNNKIIVVSTGPHFDVFKNVINGWFEASIRGDLIRKVFGLEPKTMQEAIIEVTDNAGSPKAATFTTQYKSATDKVEIKGLGFTFSSTKIAITLKKPAEAETPPPSNKSASNTSGSSSADNSMPNSKRNSTRIYTLKNGASIIASPGDLLVFKSTVKGRWLVESDASGLIQTSPMPKGLGITSGVALRPTATGTATVPIKIGSKVFKIKLIVK